ncbi:MAG: hypothetical protein Kow002_11110 [Anaerolineales bacterium]
MTIQNRISTVIISNFAEAHVDFLARAADEQERKSLIYSESAHADRTLLWCGDPKLALVSFPVAHASWVINRLGYTNTRYLAPENPSSFLCKDILREPALLNGLLEYAGPERTLQLIPYATTPEFLGLVDILRDVHNLTILLPESPDRDHLWLRDYADSKAGFRLLASSCLPDADRLLPFGIVCHSLKEAAQAIAWFNLRGQACVVKANTGESGIGFNIFKPSQHATQKDILAALQGNPFLGNEPVVVEEYIHSPNRLSPSPEVFVPRPEDGEPYIMYMTTQVLENFGDFFGIEINRGLYEQAWYPDLERSSLTIARQLQTMGYVGHFDMDCLVDENGQLRLLEVNARRTGGTHVHDFAEHVIGPDYIDKVALLSYEAMRSGRINNAEELLTALKDYLYPMGGDVTRGIVVTITTPIVAHRFGSIIVAPTQEEARALQTEILAYLSNY